MLVGLVFVLTIHVEPGVRSWFYSNQPHHSSVFVFQKVAVVKKIADGILVTKIHPHPYAGVRESSAVVIGDVYGIAKKRLIHRPA